jgi:hypothetical protein
MKKVSFVAGKEFYGNTIFNKKQNKLKIGSFDKYYKLYDEFLINGYKIATDDIHKPEESDIVLYFDMPKTLPPTKDKNKSFLLAIESSIVKPENFNKEKHKFFNKIFTWDDNLVDNEKYIKINYAFNFPPNIYKEVNRQKLCCLIVSNKKSGIKNELYSERKKLIKWFEQNYTKDFDLYGFGWNSFRFEGPLAVRALNRLPFLQKIMFNLVGEKFASYKGKVDSKFETMKKYRFAIAYENVKNENGYITEKIFDAFIAGCVPVYWGAKNIEDYIPSNCFIDRRNFKNNKDLYKFLKKMPDDEYLQYLNSIEKYLNSKKVQVFSADYFAKNIVTNCIEKNRNDIKR